MRASLTMLACLVPVLFLTCCGEKEKRNDQQSRSGTPPPTADSREVCDAELARLMTGYGQVVKSIHDQSSWDLAKPRIEAILAEIPRVTAKLQKLPAPTPQDFELYFPRTQERENALQEALGDRDAFLAQLPPAVAAELLNLAGQFHTVMGAAQLALRGPPPPRKIIPRSAPAPAPSPAPTSPPAPPCS